MGIVRDIRSHQEALILLVVKKAAISTLSRITPQVVRNILDRALGTV
jgi:hypothetical protein